jgi:hypothetical protein
MRRVMLVVLYSPEFSSSKRFLRSHYSPFIPREIACCLPLRSVCVDAADHEEDSKI